MNLTVVVILIETFWKLFLEFYKPHQKITE